MTLFFSTATPVGAAAGRSRSPASVTSMPLPLADVILFLSTTTSALRAPMRMAGELAGV